RTRRGGLGVDREPNRREPRAQGQQRDEIWGERPERNRPKPAAARAWKIGFERRKHPTHDLTDVRGATSRKSRRGGARTAADKCCSTIQPTCLQPTWELAPCWGQSSSASTVSPAMAVCPSPTSASVPGGR